MYTHIPSFIYENASVLFAPLSFMPYYVAGWSSRLRCGAARDRIARVFVCVCLRTLSAWGVYGGQSERHTAHAIQAHIPCAWSFAQGGVNGNLLNAPRVYTGLVVCVRWWCACECVMELHVMLVCAG